MGGTALAEAASTAYGGAKALATSEGRDAFAVEFMDNPIRQGYEAEQAHLVQVAEQHVQAGGSGTGAMLQAGGILVSDVTGATEAAEGIMGFSTHELVATGYARDYTTGERVVHTWSGGGKVFLTGLSAVQMKESFAAGYKGVSAGQPSGGAPARQTSTPEACFVAGTPVLTPAGYRCIEELGPGSQVIACDILSGTTGTCSVDRRFRREVSEVVEVRIGETTVATTADHPFYVVDCGWVEAGGLVAGDALPTADGGVAQVFSVTVSTSPATPVYNLEVNGLHTYFVSELCVLVHNNCSADAGAKATRSTGTTAGGGRVDQYGQKLGPSGKPQVNVIRHPTHKGATDAARLQGRGAPVKHSTPTRGKGHFHATDVEGRKLPGSTHHEYPQ
jgi:hypothetical protein